LVFLESRHDHGIWGMILFLDYDGVLHPSEVYLNWGRPTLKAEGSLFMWAGHLNVILADLPHVRLILSTSWVRNLGYKRARDYLPDALRNRVIGSTWETILTDSAISEGLPLSYWQDAPRYQQIKRYADRMDIAEWVAVDDNADCWADYDRSLLIQTDPTRGLSDPEVAARLRVQLSRLPLL
jgi:hypothetical protein